MCPNTSRDGVFTQSPPLYVPASYVQDRAEQIIRPTHSVASRGRKRILAQKEM